MLVPTNHVQVFDDDRCGHHPSIESVHAKGVARGYPQILHYDDLHRLPLGCVVPQERGTPFIR